MLFADDTSLYSSHTDPAQAKAEVTELLSSASDWFASNKLSLNDNKTQEIQFSLARSIKLDSEPVKLLGFTLDPKLTWEKHIDEVCKRLSRVIYLLRRLSVEMPYSFVKLAFSHFFRLTLSMGLEYGDIPPMLVKY